MLERRASGHWKKMGVDIQPNCTALILIGLVRVFCSCASGEMLYTSTMPNGTGGIQIHVAAMLFCRVHVGLAAEGSLFANKCHCKQHAQLWVANRNSEIICEIHKRCMKEAFIE